MQNLKIWYLLLNVNLLGKLNLRMEQLLLNMQNYDEEL